jgi:hypothetical protein
MYIADYNNHVVRQVDHNGTISTYAGNGSYGYSGDNGPATAAQFSYIYGLAFDTSGILFIVDKDNHVIRKVKKSGIVTTVAGNGGFGFSGDNGPATSAQLHWPYQIAFDSSGNMFIADSYNSHIRKVDKSNSITTYVGNGRFGYSGDNGPATSAELNSPFAVTVDLVGNLFIGDRNNNVYRKVNTNGIITTVAGNGTGGLSGDNGPATSAELNGPGTFDSSGTMYISDTYNSRVRVVYR